MSIHALERGRRQKCYATRDGLLCGARRGLVGLMLGCFMWTFVIVITLRRVAVYSGEDEENDGTRQYREEAVLTMRYDARQLASPIPAEMVPVRVDRTSFSAHGKRILDAEVHLCALDREANFQLPYPKFKDWMRRSGCPMDRRNHGYTMTMRGLEEKILEDPKSYLEPRGFVFDMSFSGSKLMANLLGASPTHLLYSEAPLPAEIFKMCDAVDCAEGDKVSALRAVILGMGKTTAHKHLFFNFHSSMIQHLPTFSKAFPNTPWVFLYWEPISVLESMLRYVNDHAHHHHDANPMCLRSRQRPSAEMLDILGMSAVEAQGVSDEEYCAAHLGAIWLTALEACQQGEEVCLMMNYDTLPQGIVPLLRQYFKSPLSEIDEERVLQASVRYTRTMVKDLTSSNTFGSKDRASEAMKRAASKYLQPTYSELEKHGIPSKFIPDTLGGREGTSSKLAEEERFTALELTPEYLRGLKRVVDPLAPDFMSSRYFSAPMEEFNCPEEPPEDYPKGYPVLDVIRNWNPDDASYVAPKMYLSTCRFDYQQELRKAMKYHNSEKPFILYNIPSLDAAVGRWSDPAYMNKILGGGRKYDTERSKNNHFLYYDAMPGSTLQTVDSKGNATTWVAPTDSVELSYGEWLYLATAYARGGRRDPANGEHWYFRVGDMDNLVIREELEIFQWPDINDPTKGNIFLKEPEEQRGIHCRFGMPGVIAEAHYDGSRNMVAILSGVRRWIMAHPNQCYNMYLFPDGHPSERHSEVNWAKPDLQKYPDFPDTLVSEVLLRAGEVLYVPTDWMHYIVNIGINTQCSSRSGASNEYKPYVYACEDGHTREKVKEEDT